MRQSACLVVILLKLHDSGSDLRLNDSTGVKLLTFSCMVPGACLLAQLEVFFSSDYLSHEPLSSFHF